jgi:uncharacterized damage-inducible protein DinB
MKLKEQCLKLHAYHTWANDTLFAHLKKLPPEIWRQPLQSVFPSLFDALVHVYKFDNVWLHAMSGDGMEETMSAIGRRMEGIQSKSLEEMTVLYGEIAERYRTYIREHDMELWKKFPHPELGVLEAKDSDILQHVVNHGTYHRGNVTAMLRQLGHTGVATDYIFYLYEV